MNDRGLRAVHLPQDHAELLHNTNRFRSRKHISVVQDCLQGPSADIFLDHDQVLVLTGDLLDCRDPSDVVVKKIAVDVDIVDGQALADIYGAGRAVLNQDDVVFFVEHCDLLIAGQCQGVGCVHESFSENKSINVRELYQ